MDDGTVEIDNDVLHRVRQGGHPVSACPKGHPLPTLPTRWFDGVAWRDGREACRHCYEADVAMDRTEAAVA